jgi:HNH endonuclease
MSNENYYLIQIGGANSGFAKVSLNKIENVINHKWYLGKDGYPFTYIKGARIPLHRYIWWCNTGNWYNNKLYVDHINRDKLDATDDNLRLSTPAENSYNKTSKNIIIDPFTNKPLHHIKLKKNGYEVSLSKNGIVNKINNIKSLEDAKNIYNQIAIELFGDFAVLY